MSLCRRPQSELSIFTEIVGQRGSRLVLICQSGALVHTVRCAGTKQPSLPLAIRTEASWRSPPAAL